MLFLIVRKSYGSEIYEVYHLLQAKTKETALIEAAEYLSGGDARATSDPEDVFEVVQTVSKPLKARYSFSVSVSTNKELTKKLVLKVLKVLKKMEK
ncbi:MAG: hypothetical protein ABIF22_02490 [bacterium]